MRFPFLRRGLAVAGLALLAVSPAVNAQVVINFDDQAVAPGTAQFPGNTYAGSGVSFTSGNITNTVAVGDTITLFDAISQFTIANNPAASISGTNFGVTAFGVNTTDVLFGFSTPVTAAQLTTDDQAGEVGDVVRLLALAPTANPNEFTVLALAQGLDDATTSPANLLSVSLPGNLPFSFALFQTTTELEGFDDLTFTPAAPAAAIPEPGTLALLLVGSLTTGAGVLRRRRA